jgi:hypothetical protein
MSRLGNARGRMLAVGLVSLAATYAAPASAALDLTGTWEGKWSCKDVTFGAATKPSGTVTMTVTQSGGNANASLHRTLKDGSDGGTETYQGRVLELVAKPGQGASTLVGCETRPGSNNYAETLSANVKVASSGATFKGVSAYQWGATPSAGGQCKYSFKRTTTADPGVAACSTGCGNGIIEAGEQCDAGNLNGQTCETQVAVSGLLLCSPGCTFDTTQCYGQRFARTRSVNDVTVVDHQTNLQWEMKTDDGSVHDKDNMYSLTATYAGTVFDGTAFTAFLATLNTPPCYAGHCDWRLPTIAELQTILLEPYPCGTNPCIDDVFGPTATNYWSTTVLATYYAEYVAFPDGSLSNGLMHFDGFVRAVRSAP